MERDKVFGGISAILLISMLLFSGVSISNAAHHEKGKKTTETTATDVKEEVVETYETLKSYTLEQRNEAMAASKDKLRDLDAQIDEIEQNLDRRWQDMSQATRKKVRESLKVLRQKREEVAEWYGGMRHSSSEAWEEVKKGFADSYDRLKKAVKEAGEEYQDKK